MDTARRYFLDTTICIHIDYTYIGYARQLTPPEADHNTIIDTLGIYAECFNCAYMLTQHIPLKNIPQP